MSNVRMVMPRTGSPSALNDIEHLLSEGAEVLGTRSTMGGKGFNGFMRTLVLTDGATTARAIVRPPQAQAAQEAFVWSLARSAGADYLFAPVMLRETGEAMVGMVPGETAGAAHVRDYAGLEKAAAHWYQLNKPEMGARAIAEQARVDREIMTVIDYLLANIDRGVNNLMVDSEGGGFYAIDMGWIGGGERLAHQTRPRMLQPFAGGAHGVVELHPRTVEVLRANLPADKLRGLLERLQADLKHYQPEPDASFRQRFVQANLAKSLSREGYANGVLQRYAKLLETGHVEYEVPRGEAVMPTAVFGTFVRAHPTGLAVAGVGAATAGAGLVRN